MQIPKYSPLTIQSDLSISTARIQKEVEKIKEANKNKGVDLVIRVFRPDSYEDASFYLGNYLGKTGDMTTPLNFKESIEQKMQDKLNTPNLHTLNQKKQNNNFGGYAIDEYGFMGEEFLKAANLPSDYKIHKNVLQAIYDVFTIPVPRMNANDVHAIFDSIDIIAGVSYAYQEIQSLTQGKFDSKEAYSEDEIKQMLKDDFVRFRFNFSFDTPLMQDYKNEKGEFKREGILLRYAFAMDTFTKAESPFTKLSEYGKFVNGMPSSYSPNEENPTKKPKTPEELKKEMLNQLDEIYLKILENTQEAQSNLKPIIAKNTLKEIDELLNQMIRKVHINNEAS